MHQIQPQRRARLLADSILLLAAIGSGHLASAATGSLPPATSTQYEFAIIDIPDQVFMAPLGIANDGTVCGLYYDADFRSHGFLWRDGHVTNLDAPGWRHTQPTGRNDHGLVAGVLDNQQFTGPGTGSKVFIYNTRRGAWTLLPDIPGQPVANNTFVNNEGVVCGSSSQGTEANEFNSVAWTWDGRSYSFFSAPGASPSGLGTAATGINDHGDVSGFFQDDAGALHGFLKIGASIRSFDVPGADNTQLFGINNEGDIIGGYYVGNQFTNFIIQNGHLFSVPAPDGGTVFGINDHRQLTGTYIDSSGIWHGFVATPRGHNERDE